MEIHHIGYAVKYINKAINDFKILGFHQISKIYTDDTRKVYISFLFNNIIQIELVAPINDHSPINQVLKNGETPYHLCFAVTNIDDEIAKLKKYNFISIDNPSESLAINNRRVCFIYKLGIGLIELVEK